MSQVHRTQSSKFFRVAEGKAFAGVCIGLEVAEKGTAVGWRLFFILTTIFTGFPLFIYIALAMSHPLVETEEEARRLQKKIPSPTKASTADGEATPVLTEIEANLSKLVAMKEKGLLTNEATLALTGIEANLSELVVMKEKGLLTNEATPVLTGIEANLSKLVAMKEKGLLTEDEFAKMRKKELGID